MTSRNSFKTMHLREFIWLAPFLCVALMAFALLRPLPRFIVPDRGRTVVDAGGTPVRIAVPFHGTALTWGTQLNDYLHDTHAPESLLNVGHDDREHFGKQVISWIYPQVVKKDSLWDAEAVSRSRGANAEIETLLAYNPGAYIGIGWGPVPLLRRVGLPALYVGLKAKNMDDRFFRAARVETALVGQPERGESLISDYRKAFAELEQELRPSTLTSRPRVLLIASSTTDRNMLDVRGSRHEFQIYLPRAGIDNASDGHAGLRPDAERILAMEPDIVFLMWGQSPREFMLDPRWRGLRAVREKRVYRMPGSYPAYIEEMQFRPLWTRWMAEIAYPERMRPKLRQALKDSFVREFGYRMSDDQIDAQLHIDENKDSAGYERFGRNYQANRGEGPAR